MASKLSWLHTCKSVQLKAIATAIGINSSGTKPLLTSQLLQHLPHGYFRHDTGTESHNDIISIDMGIRNLAYCRLSHPQNAPLGKSGPRSSKSIPIISEWTRLSISQAPITSPTTTKEAFDPSTYSQYAYDLITSLLSHHRQPSHILIERQRFRSMGGSAVQEWTLRVNTFEAMLYAVLRTLKEKGIWNGDVLPVTPARVAKFWLGEGEGEGEDCAKGRGSKSQKTKTAKIELVAKWLEAGNHLKLEGEAEGMAKNYLRKRTGEKKSSKQGDKDGKTGGNVGKVAEMAKLDDLADCLLQGMAWIKWEQNRRMILSEGIEALDKLR